MQRWSELEELAAIAQNREAFAAQLSVPVLISVKDLPDAAPQGGFATTTTHVFDPFGDSEGLRRDAAVYRVEKRAGAPFSDMISVGRTRAADIRLAFAGISKFHAYFTRQGGEGSYALVDAGSTNGTFVAGERLVAQALTPLGDSVEVAFGKVAFRFFTPLALYAFLGR